MNRGPSLFVLVAIVVIAGAVVLLLATGGPSTTSADAGGDVEVSEGGGAPKDTSVADLTKGGATVDDAEVVLEATVDGDIPESLDEGALTFRWEISEDDIVTWIVTASVDIERTASIVATQFEYSGSTIDDSLPGRLEVEGSTVRVTLDPNELKDFPETFTWSVSTTLDGDRGKATSATAVDNVPDEGSLDAGS